MFHYKGSEIAVGQFQRQTGSLDIRYIEEYPISRTKYQVWRPSLIVVSDHCKSNWSRVTPGDFLVYK